MKNINWEIATQKIIKFFLINKKPNFNKLRSRLTFFTVVDAFQGIK